MKEVYIKIYDTAGNLTRVLYEFIFSEFTESLNGGLGYCSIQIPEKFDNFGLGTTIDKDYGIKIVINDREGEVTVYSGRIEEIEAGVDDRESVILHCHGYIAELALNLHESAQKIKFTYSQWEITDIIKDILDKHTASQTGAKVDYATGSTSDTAKDITIKFFASTVLDALLGVIQKADSDWFFRVGADNVFYFDEISATPTHLFMVGRDVGALNILDSNQKKITRYLFFNGLPDEDPLKIAKVYSSGDADRRFKIERDDRVTVSTTADEQGARYIDTYGNGLQTVDAIIIDSNLGGGYDIESINVGDTCKFINVETNSPLPENGIITSKVYNPNFLQISVADARQYVAKMLIEQKQRQALVEFGEELPLSYTT